VNWYVDNLVCPRDRGALRLVAAQLECASGHRYPIVEGVPVMLVDDATPTIDSAPASLAAAAAPGDPLFLSTLSLSDEERQGIRQLAQRGGHVDPVVAYLIAATNGLMYKHLVGRLEQYPIPALPLPKGGGRRLLDIGCGWGRWSLAASAQGYDVVGIDPSLGAVLAARRVAVQLGRDVRFVVGDARYLPFPSASADVVFSYSVLQHFSREDASAAVGQIGRVLRPGGMTKVQFPTRYGVRCLYHQARRGFRAPSGFEVRYWTWPQLGLLFGAAVGPSRFEVDGYFGIGLQGGDARFMTPARAAVLRASEWLTRASRRVTPLARLADSVFVESIKPCAESPAS
jgi:SAM-dependent methyltransferase/uncharacterized protein YbaR (Trm112 family)